MLSEKEVQAIVEKVVAGLEVRAREIEAVPTTWIPPDMQRLCEARALGIRDGAKGLRAAFAAGIRDGIHAVELALAAVNTGACPVCPDPHCPNHDDHTGRVVNDTRILSYQKGK